MNSLCDFQRFSLSVIHQRHFSISSRDFRVSHEQSAPLAQHRVRESFSLESHACALRMRMQDVFRVHWGRDPGDFGRSASPRWGIDGYAFRCVFAGGGKSSRDTDIIEDDLFRSRRRRAIVSPHKSVDVG